MKLEKLLYETKDGIAVITMNYMKNLNAIDEQMAEELKAALDQAELERKGCCIKRRGPSFFSRRRYRLFL